MKIIHLSAYLSRRAGGIFEIELAVALHLRQQGVVVAALGLADADWPKDSARWSPVPARVFPTSGPAIFGYAPGLLPQMFAEQADLVHLHYMWMYPSVAVRRWATKTRQPYLVTPNGMLEPWALKNSAWKKKLAGMFYENRMLHGAACLQANTEKEAADFRAYGLTNPIAIIPNGIDLTGAVASGERGARSGERRAEDGGLPSALCPLPTLQRKVLLYLGRIHPKKGLVHLLRAWGQIQNLKFKIQNSEPWVLAIAGWDQGGHEAELKQLATELGIPFADIREPNLQPATCHLPPSLLFLGPQFGDAKTACYRDCDAFILPSFSEGLPMVVLEAWAHGKPVLMTPACNLPEGFAANAAIRIEHGAGSGAPGTEGIERGLRELFQTPGAQLRALGARGRALVAEKFAWPKVAAELHSVYRWLLGGGPPPGCVRLD